MGWRRIGEGFEDWVGGKLAEPILSCHDGGDENKVREWGSVKYDEKMLQLKVTSSARLS